MGGFIPKVATNFVMKSPAVSVGSIPMIGWAMLGDMNETIDLPIPELVQPKI